MEETKYPQSYWGRSEGQASFAIESNYKAYIMQ